MVTKTEAVVSRALLLALMICWVGSVRAQTGARHSGRPAYSAVVRLVHVPTPDVSQMEDRVRAQIEEAQMAVARSRRAGQRDLGLAYGRLGNVCQAYGLNDTAAAAYHNAHVLDPREFRWSYFQAVLAENSGNLAEAAADYSIAQKAKPEDEIAMLRLANINVRRNRIAEAEALYSRVLKASPNSVAALDGLARIAMARQQNQKAIELLTRALGIDPQASYLHYPLAVAYRRVGELDKAATELQQHGPAAPELIDPYVTELQQLKVGRAETWKLASQQMSAGEFPEAAESYRKLVNLNGQDILARIYLGTALARAGKTLEAITELRTAVRMAPGNAKAQYCLGIVLADSGKDQEAIPHLRVSTDRDPEFAEGHFQLANVLMRAREWKEAAAEFAKVQEHESQNPFEELMHAMTLVRLGKYAEAYDILVKAHANAPADADITGALARLLAATPDDSVRDARRGLALLQQTVRPGGDVEAAQAETIAMALAEIGQFEKAVQVQRSVIQSAEAENSSRIEALRENLVLYEQGQPCRIPWRDDDPIFVPVPQNAAAMAQPQSQVLLMDEKTARR